MNRKSIIISIKGYKLTKKKKIILKRKNHGELFYLKEISKILIN